MGFKLTEIIHIWQTLFSFLSSTTVMAAFPVTARSRYEKNDLKSKVGCDVVTRSRYEKRNSENCAFYRKSLVDSSTSFPGYFLQRELTSS